MREPTHEEMVEGIATGFKSFLLQKTDPHQGNPILLSELLEKGITAAAKEHLSKQERKAGFIELGGKIIPVFYTYDDGKDQITCIDSNGQIFTTSSKYLISEVK